MNKLRPKKEKLLPESLFKINTFNNFYKPFRLTVFHETYFFNILQVNRLNEPASTSLTGHLKAIIDPFLQLSNKRNDPATNQTVQPNSMSNPSTESESDEEFVVLKRTSTPSLAKLNEVTVDFVSCASSNANVNFF
jgi:hypothetical protein